MPHDLRSSPSLPRCPTERDATVFLLVRHAQSQANVDGQAEQDTDSFLDALGEQQAERLALTLRETRIDAIHSSDARRAQGTVAPLSAEQGATVLLSERLREPRGHRRPERFADADQAASLVSQFQSGDPPPAFPPPETHAEVVARLRRFLEDLRLTPGGTVVLCSHYVTLNVLVRLLIDLRDPPASLWAHFDNASVTRVDVPAHRQPLVGLLKYLNWTPPG